MFPREFSDRIYHCHMKDAALQLDGRSGILGSHYNFGDPRRGWDFRSLGHGGVDFEEIIRTLNAIGYIGPLSVEWEDSAWSASTGPASPARLSPGKIDFERSSRPSTRLLRRSRSDPFPPSLHRRHGRALGHDQEVADRALAQASDEAFFHRISAESTTLAEIVKHMAGNMRSRWTDWLTSDGEKPDRDRDSEFEIGPDDTRALADGALGSWLGARRTPARRPANPKTSTAPSSSAASRIQSAKRCTACSAT
ncbi:MAG: DUF1572 family protein [Bryobacterales bacterium]